MRAHSVSFTIEGTLPVSDNQGRTMNWGKRYRLAQEFNWLVIAAISKADIRCLKAWSDLGLKLRIKMEVSNPRMFDEQNLSAFSKGTLDFLVTKGWLRNDSPEFVEFEKPSQSKGKKAITFRISPVEENQ